MAPEKSVTTAVVAVHTIPQPRDVPLEVCVPVCVTHYDGPAKVFLRYNQPGSPKFPYENFSVGDGRRRIHEAFAGMFCLVCHDSRTQSGLRAQIKAVYANSSGLQALVKVLYVDIGREDFVELDCVYPIDAPAAAEPRGTVECCLYRLQPTPNSSRFDLVYLVPSWCKISYEAIFHSKTDTGVYEVSLFTVCFTESVGLVRTNFNDLLVYNRRAEFSSCLRDTQAMAGNLAQDARQVEAPVREYSSMILDVSPSALSDHTDTSNNKFLSYRYDTPAIDGNLVQPARQLALPVCKGTSMTLDASPLTLSRHADVSSDRPAPCCELAAAKAPNGNAWEVKVTYICTPDHWYGQLISMLKHLSKVCRIISSSHSESACCEREVKKGSYCIYRDLPHEKGARVRVEEVLDLGKSRIFLIDYGNRKVISSSCLFRMDKRLYSISPIALRFQLVGIRPWSEWTDTAVTAFERFTLDDSPLTVEVLDTQSCGGEFGDKVHLVKLFSETYGNVAERMIRDGYARMPAGRRDRKTRPVQNVNSGDMQMFDPMQDDYSDYSDYRLQTNEPVPSLLRRTRPPMVGSMVFGQVSACSSPHFFYLIFPYGRNSVEQLIVEDVDFEPMRCFESLMEELQHECSLRKFSENILYIKSKGELVAARSNRDKRWYRGQIVSNGHDDIVQVFFVDFGFCEWLPIMEVKTLNDCFAHVPFQAHSACIVTDGFGFLRDKTGGDAQICEVFLDCVARKDLLVGVDHISEGLLHVRLYFIKNDTLFNVVDCMKAHKKC